MVRLRSGIILRLTYRVLPVVTSERMPVFTVFALKRDLNECPVVDILKPWCGNAL